MDPIVVFPVCSKDVSLAWTHSRWLMKMGHRNKATAIVYDEQGCDPMAISEMLGNLGKTFTKVIRRPYRKMERTSWPIAPNRIFQKVANDMSRQCMPWLWFEPDAVALKPQWVDMLFREYAMAGQPFMGAHVEHMKHVNGTAIYPATANELLATAMTAEDYAWDYECGDEMQPHTHNVANTLMQHVWTMVGGKFSAVGGGELPVNITPDIAKSQIRSGAAMIHRIKDDSLLKLLITEAFIP